MRIVDAHEHIGTCRVFDVTQTPEALLRAMDVAGVDCAVVQPYPGSADAAADHDQIAQLATTYPGRFFGLASVNPHCEPKAYRREINRCVNELGFVGIKLHPLGHAVSPGSRDAELVFRTAADLDIPLMIHTGPGIPFAAPAAWLPMIAQFSALAVVLGHAGAGLLTSAAIGVASVCENVVLETSWCNAPDIANAIRLLGPQRVMYGSDELGNIGPELAKYETAGLSDEVRRAVLGGSASRFFGLGDRRS